MGSLTARKLESLKPQPKPYKVTDGDGLYVFVSPTGTRSWRANYAQAGKQKTRTYGTFPDLSLAQARQAHQQARAAQPPADAPAPAVSPTFRAVARLWMAKHLPGLKNAKHKLQVENTLERFVHPAIGDRAINSILRRELAEIVIASLGKQRRIETAHRVAGRIGAVFSYAVDSGFLDAHPALHLSRVLPNRPPAKHMACVEPEEAPQLLRDIAGYPDLVTRLALQLLSLTLVRTNELRLMRWSEVREDGAVWVIPAERMKQKTPHVVPLSTQARAVLAKLREISGSDLVLESPANPGHPISENTMLFALYRLGYKGRMTGHGFRALASTVLNESGKFEPDWIEKQLSHQEADEVRAAYNRAKYLPQRRDLMEWWGNWIQATAASQPPASA